MMYHKVPIRNNFIKKQECVGVLGTGFDFLASFRDLASCTRVGTDKKIHPSEFTVIS